MNPQRSIRHITKTEKPEEIYKMIMSGTIEYTEEHMIPYTCEDRAFLSALYLTGGRIGEVCGGWKRKVIGTERDETGKIIKQGIEKRQDTDHQGLLAEKIKIYSDRIEIIDMPVIKRTDEIIKKYGQASTLRPLLIYPLERNISDNIYFDQYVPFSWLLLEFIQNYAPKKGKVFRYKSNRGWRICNAYTEQHPHWFRAQASRFHINYIEKDSLKHAQYMKRNDFAALMKYIDYDVTSMLKIKTDNMIKFDWIDSAVKRIKRRMELSVNT